MLIRYKRACLSGEGEGGGEADGGEEGEEGLATERKALLRYTCEDCCSLYVCVCVFCWRPTACRGMQGGDLRGGGLACAIAMFFFCLCCSFVGGVSGAFELNFLVSFFSRTFWSAFVFVSRTFKTLSSWTVRGHKDSCRYLPSML